MSTSTIRVKAETKQIITTYASDKNINQTDATERLVLIAINSGEAEKLLARITELETALSGMINHVQAFESALFGDEEGEKCHTCRRHQCTCEVYTEVY